MDYVVLVFMCLWTYYLYKITMTVETMEKRLDDLCSVLEPHEDV